jgi:hypothetical protein
MMGFRRILISWTTPSCSSCIRLAVISECVFIGCISRSIPSRPLVIVVAPNRLSVHINLYILLSNFSSDRRLHFCRNNPRFSPPENSDNAPVLIAVIDNRQTWYRLTITNFVIESHRDPSTYEWILHEQDRIKWDGVSYLSSCSLGPSRLTGSGVVQLLSILHFLLPPGLNSPRLTAS